MFRFLYDDKGLRFYRSARTQPRAHKSSTLEKTQAVTLASDVVIRPRTPGGPPPFRPEEVYGTGRVRRHQRYKLERRVYK